MTNSRAIDPYLRPLHRLFQKSGNGTIARGQQAYLKGHFRFHGIKSPERRVLLRSFLAMAGPPPVDRLAAIVRSAWSAEEREMHYAGMELFASKARVLDPSWLPLADEIILQNSWWDTVDYIAVHIVGAILARHREALLEYNSHCMESDQLWLQRTALIMQLQWKGRTDEELLFQNCRTLAGHPDFFIRKGIGWALRQYARTNPVVVRQFVSSHSLSPLSAREALKRI